MKFFKLSLLLFSLGISQKLLADVPYLEFQYGYVSADVDDNTVHPSLLTANFGYQFLRNFAVEAIFGAGLRSEEITLKVLVGLGITANIPITQTVQIYGRFGYNSLSYNNKNSSASELGPSYGLGMALKVSSHSAITLEYRSLATISEDDITLNTIFLGWRFQ